ncbi:MAG: hypothetical protein HOE53_04340 [Candidatus Magasanikbacteria bacterium]|jgi:hypothetical protein|nr:hypothetical protein [Candidatus Magasanikbacteria bacterium]
MTITKKQLYRIIAASGILFSLALIVQMRAAILIGFAGLIFAASVISLRRKKTPTPLTDAVGALALCMIFGTAGYWITGLTAELYATGALLFAALLLYLSRNISSATLNWKFERASLFSFFEAFAYLFLLYLLFSKRTGDMLTSVWLVTSYKIFVAFILLTLFSLVHSYLRFKSYPKSVLVLRYLLISSVAAIVIVHGMGFDPFIHQAAEKVISELGVITPRTPFYIGQYVLVQAAHVITGISTARLDIMLVPLLAGITLPLFFHRFFLQAEAKRPAALVIAASLLPLGFVIMTTPHALALLIGLLTMLSLQTDESKLLPFLLALAAVCVHPLIGVPLLLITLLFHHKLQSKAVQIILFSAITLVVPIMLIAYGVLQGNPLTLQGINLAAIGTLLNPFAVPHYFLYTNPSLFLSALYVYKVWLLPVLGLVLVVLGARKRYAPTIKASLALIFSAVIVAGGIQIPGVISYEQLNYASRLLQLALLCLFPLYLYGLMKIFEWAQKRNYAPMYVLFSLSLLLAVSWYFTYPTRDAVSHYTGFVVRDADIEALNIIDKNEGGTHNYIALSNQTISAAALKVHGFAKYHETTFDGPQYFFPIPTGGPLYSYYKKMVYEKPKRAWMIDAMKYAGVKKAYFIHTNYWAPAAEIRDEAKKEADRWFTVDDQIWVYEYVLGADE